MAQDSSPDESRERAVSSEPCTTRPNPFDDTDVSSRKRRRTSLTGASRSRSLDMVNSSPGPMLPGDSALEPQSDSAMKLDTDPTTPTTPETQQPSSITQPPSSTRSSRVTINVRTPSRVLEVIPSSPPSPVPRGAAASRVASSAGDIHISVEETEADIPREETVIGTPVSSKADSNSPPIEIIPDQPDDVEFNNIEPEVTILGSFLSMAPRDPSGEMPFRDSQEKFAETFPRILSYFHSHDTISQEYAEWLEKYVIFFRNVGYSAAMDSYRRHKDMWQSIADTVLQLNTRKAPTPRNSSVRRSNLLFYRKFARLVALFVELDVKTLRSWASSDRNRRPDLVSPTFVQALALFTRKEESSAHQQIHFADDAYDLAEVEDVLDAFTEFHMNTGGSLAHLKQLAMIEAECVALMPKLIDHLAFITLLIANIVGLSQRKMKSLQHPGHEQAKGHIARGYTVFQVVSAALAGVMEKHVNLLSSEVASHLLAGLTEIFHISLATEMVVPPDTTAQTRQDAHGVPSIYIPEVIAFHWKFTVLTKLIMSSQMQLRVMAVAAMCSDLVSLFRKFSDSSPDCNVSVMHFISDFLSRTGLVSYILGTTCHPEIIAESSNIVGFLVVSGTYTEEHSDKLWHTITTTQDPRVSDALIRMINRIANLFPYQPLMYLLRKMSTLPIEAFSPPMRELCDGILKVAPAPRVAGERSNEKFIPDTTPYEFLIRLMRQSCTFGTTGPVAYPEIQQFAIVKFKDLLNYGPPADCRPRLFLDCLDDLARKSPYTLGSLWALFLMLQRTMPRELHFLVSEHDFTRLLIEELESAITATRNTAFPHIIDGVHNNPRRELIMCLLYHESGTLTNELGMKLWHLLVGPRAACGQDRETGWKILMSATKRPPGVNPFIETCFSDYLPSLQPDCFCLGALEFVRDKVVTLVNDPTSILLDDAESPDRAGLEQLWRIALTALPGTIESHAVHTLVSDVYINSRSIVTFSPYRARKVHLALVGRCLRQLSSAAAYLRAPSNGISNGDDDCMALVATAQEVFEQQLLFTRSLAILREFHCLHQARGQFAAPDLRSLILNSPGDVEGELAELKYQSFDGDSQSTVAPLVIGKSNTAASLLASLREATGFNNFRVYYKGAPFVPQECDLNKSLEQLQICSGIFLVKRESDAGFPAKTRAGASPVEVEILGHFEQMWGYLSMEERYAQEIYNFLVKLPADESTLAATMNPNTPYLDVFPLGQPFKCLYAIYALKECIASQRRKSVPSSLQKQLNLPSVPFPKTLLRATDLIVSAINDEDVIAQCSSQSLRIDLLSSLIGCFVSLLKDPFLPADAAEFLNQRLLDRLLALLTATLSTDKPNAFPSVISLCLESILEACSFSEAFMSAYCADERGSRLLELMLVKDSRLEVRRGTAVVIMEKVKGNLVTSNPAVDRFRDFFWPLVSRMVRNAVVHPAYPTQALEVCLSMLLMLREARPQILDMQRLVDDWTKLLLEYTTTEDVTLPDAVDSTALNLIRLLHTVLSAGNSDTPRRLLPKENSAQRIFWKHLFPAHFPGSPTPRPILNSQTRGMLIEIILTLVEKDATQMGALLNDLDGLVPVFSFEDDIYAYELVQQFDRTKAIRAPCGYAGLKNLSNTCYLNSLLTQLFMNIDFRKFMLSAEITDGEHSQNLLFQTQKLFGFMQESIRRFITPDDMVGCIKTWDEIPIDIHNQMDVDEFYSILFDQWEEQFRSDDEKCQLRSFYGGQLVQQVSSQECDHISERMEPFSAIQCDIKGKASLEESLQAYVDGEIMEGDNKYKCSTCDRHVDAVKRACLKNIPDNLIFHLKRFDYNIRMMQRNKINDAFAFPMKIDMRPYTIEHLSNPSEDKGEDIFELVGVLIHSGTAESGHYYSFVRERPSSSASPVWVEFNDDLVTPWNPSEMENACFGGHEYRNHFEHGGVPFEKTYSAYMLFYERSSSLARAQELLRRSGRASPFRVELSPNMIHHIQDENLNLLRRHCLYDPTQIQFVTLTMMHLKTLTGGKCSPDHDMETVAISLAIGHLDQVASRAKDVPDFYTLLRSIVDNCRSCVHCSLAAYQYFAENPDTLRFMIQRNPDPDVRQQVGSFVLQALRVIKEQVPAQYGIPPSDSGEESDGEDFDSRASVIAGMMDVFRVLWDNFHTCIRAWPEMFDFMLSFVNMGRHEMGEYLRQQFLRYLLLALYADPNLELPPQFARMINTISRRLATRPPSYEAIISLVDVLLAKMTFKLDSHGEITGVDSPEQRFIYSANPGKEEFWFTRQEAKILLLDWGRNQGNIFVDKLIAINQNLPSTHSIIANLVKKSTVMEQKVYTTLRVAISGQATQHLNSPYLRVGSDVLCRYGRNSALIASFIGHVSQQCLNLQSTEGKAFLDFQRAVFDGPQENSGETPLEIVLAGYDNVPIWAPGLLGYFDSAVVQETQGFLDDVLFRYAPMPDLGDSDADKRRASKIVETAKALGFRCLNYLRENYVSRGAEVQVQARLVAGHEHAIKECARFFSRKDATNDTETKEFHELFNDVLAALRSITVEELEDDGSEWENSSVCSEPLGSLEDIPMVGDLQDADIQ